MSNMMSGGWSVFRAATAEDQTVLEKALADVDIIPLKAITTAEQVIAGQNYLFVCNDKKDECGFVVAVYAKPDGTFAKEIKEIGSVFQLFDLK